MSKKGWKEIPIGGKITEAGNAAEYKTGDWRTFLPDVDREKCINCLQCWLYCPDMAINANDDGTLGKVNLDYCKGCGICAKICPVKCIEMKKENK